MKCGSCRQQHDTVQAVRSCFVATQNWEDCKHGMVQLVCVNCRPSRRYGTRWSVVFPLRYATRCHYCKDWMEDGEDAQTQYGKIAHPACVLDPALNQPSPTLYWLVQDALGEPGWNGLSEAAQSQLMQTVDAWLVEALCEERQTADELLDLLELELDDHQALVSLIEETWLGVDDDDVVLRGL